MPDPANDPVTGEPKTPGSAFFGEGSDDPSVTAAKALTTDSPLAKQYLGRMDKLTEDMEKNFAKQQETEGPYRDKLMKILDSPAAAQAHLEKVKDAPKPEDYQKNSMEFASAMAVIGAISGKWTRNAGNASLNAFAGALKGWQSGNQEAYENAAKEWEQNTKKTLDNNAAELQKYHEIIQNKKLNIDQMMAAMNLVSSEYQNKIVFDATVAKNYTMAFAAADKMEMAQMRLQNIYEKFQGIRNDQREEVKSKVEYFNTHPDQAARLSMPDYMKLKGAAGKFGFELAPHPEEFLASSQPRNAPAMALQQRMAERARAGSPMTSDEITKFSADYTAQVAGARSIGVRGANIELASNLATFAIPQALQASDAFPRGQWVPINAAKIKAYQLGSNVKLSEWDIANLQIAEMYARALNPNAYTIRKDMFDRAVDAISQAKSPEAYRATLHSIYEAMNRERSGIEATQQQQRGEHPNLPDPFAAPARGGDQGWGELKVH